MNNTDQIIRTKLHQPFIRAGLVSRPRLQERIVQGLRGPLTLITAPAGFGKTTLITSSLAGSRMTAAWLSLDPSDNQAKRFLIYLTAALQGVDHQIGFESAQILAGMQQTPVEEVLISLINDLDAAGIEIVLVLDDYQVISNSEVHEVLAFLIEHCPQNFHILLSTRSDPPLPLTLLRARGQMIELRAADLRFNVIEVEEFLNQVMHLNLDPDSVAVLAERTDGWIAGLQMAALSIRNRADISGFIEGFSGTNRYILDYLSEEVLSCQSEEIRHFLLHTSILERLCGSLCDAVIGGASNSQNTLEQLDKANLFLIPLDEEYHWYRYHHLFADLLRTRLHQSLNAQDIYRLHQRAAEWYEGNGLIYEAIHHASLAINNEYVERLIEQNYMKLTSRGESPAFLFWMGKLSKEAIYKRPWLCIYAAMSSAWLGQLEEAEVLLAEAEKNIQVEDPDPNTRRMLATQTYVKSRVTAMRGDLHKAIELNLYAREVAPTNPLPLRLMIGVGLGYEYFLVGDLDNACKLLIETIQLGRTSGDINNTVATSCVLARLYTVQGLLNKAYATYQDAERLIQEGGGQQLGAVSIVNVGMADLLYQWNHLDDAFTSINQGLEFIRLWGKADDTILAYLVQSRILQAQGNKTAALEAINKASQVIRFSGVFPEARDALMAIEARLQLSLGNNLAIDRLIGSLEARSCKENFFTFENELAHLTLARAYIASSQLEKALRLLSGMEESARSGGRRGRLIEINILKALALQAAKEPMQAEAALLESLALAQSEGFVRLFLDEGQPMRVLLAKKAAHDCTTPLGDYAVHLLSQFNAEFPARQPADEKGSLTGELVESLSRRELEVLHLMALGRTNLEIAGQLIISPGTVKAHTANIYRKLDVTNRTEAVAHARHLGILP